MAKTVALIFGIIYTLVGILGFIGSLGGPPASRPRFFLASFPSMSSTTSFI